MAKLKRKEGPIGTMCREVSTGVWRFNTGKFSWEWSLAHSGLNLSVELEKEGELSGEFMPCLFAKDLNHAVMYGQGFDMGWHTKAGEGAKL